MSEWISVKDKTPPKDRFVLAVFETVYGGEKTSKVTLAWYVGWYKRYHWEIFDDEEGRMMADDFFKAASPTGCRCRSCPYCGMKIRWKDMPADDAMERFETARKAEGIGE